MSRLVLPENRHLKGYDDDAEETDIDDSCHRGLLGNLERIGRDTRAGAPSRAIKGRGFAACGCGPLDWALSQKARCPPAMAASVHSSRASFSQDRGCTGTDRQTYRDQPPAKDHHQRADRQSPAHETDPLGHQLERIENRRRTDQRRSVVCRSPGRMLHEHTDERATARGLRLLSPNQRSHLAAAHVLTSHAARDLHPEYPESSERPTRSRASAFCIPVISREARTPF